MDEEMKELNKNQTQELVDLPTRRNIIGYEWAYSKKEQ